jgi:hypothetical protein
VIPAPARRRSVVGSVVPYGGRLAPLDFGPSPASAIVRPPITKGHLPHSSSASRFTAGASGFFIFSQSLESYSRILVTEGIRRQRLELAI